MALTDPRERVPSDEQGSLVVQIVLGGILSIALGLASGTVDWNFLQTVVPLRDEWYLIELCVSLSIALGLFDAIRLGIPPSDSIDDSSHTVSDFENESFAIVALIDLFDRISNLEFFVFKSILIMLVPTSLIWALFNFYTMTSETLWNHPVAATIWLSVLFLVFIWLELIMVGLWLSIGAKIRDFGGA
jgi:hypothetical protein